MGGSGLHRVTRTTQPLPLRVPELASPEGECVRFRYPAHIRWTCVRCGNSCRDLAPRRRNILLTAGDIKRIVSANGREPEDFSVPSRTRAPYQRKMRKLEGRCIFLQGSTCSIYKARPLICRFYPFSLDVSEDGKLEIGFDSACQGIGKGKRRGRKFFRDLADLAKRELRRQ